MYTAPPRTPAVWVSNPLNSCRLSYLRTRAAPAGEKSLRLIYCLDLRWGGGAEPQVHTCLRSALIARVVPIGPCYGKGQMCFPAHMIWTCWAVLNLATRCKWASSLGLTPPPRPRLWRVLFVACDRTLVLSFLVWGAARLPSSADLLSVVRARSCAWRTSVKICDFPAGKILLDLLQLGDIPVS